MADFTEAQVAHLQRVVTDIIGTDYAKQFHELKKRFVSLEAREQESRNKISRYQEELKKFEECHRCHTNPAQFVEVGIQCDFTETNGQVAQQSPFYVLENLSSSVNNHVDVPPSSRSPRKNAPSSNGLANLNAAPVLANSNPPPPRVDHNSASLLTQNISNTNTNTTVVNNSSHQDEDDDSDVIIIDDDS